MLACIVKMLMTSRPFSKLDKVYNVSGWDEGTAVG